MNCKINVQILKLLKRKQVNVIAFLKIPQCEDFKNGLIYYQSPIRVH